jgi:hypothetical protein
VDGSWRILAGVAVTVGGLAATVVGWPEDTGPVALGSAPRTPTTVAGGWAPHPSAPPAGEPAAEPDGRVAADLFATGAPEALGQLLAEAGGPQQLMEIAVYPEYLIVAYVDPLQPDHLDRRTWRNGAVGGAEPNPIDDRVDDETRPALFDPGAVDLARLPAMVADARTRHPMPVDATHVLIDRFLPFDERVLVRVYASPADGRSGGGYVTYLTDGSFLQRCC